MLIIIFIAMHILILMDLCYGYCLLYFSNANSNSNCIAIAKAFTV